MRHEYEPHLNPRSYSEPRNRLRFYGLYNLVEVKATGRVGLYIGGVLAPADNGGDWMEVRFEDGTHWRFRPHELKPPKGASRIFNTEK